MKPGESDNRNNYHDDVCKIIPLGRSALGVSGNPFYNSGIFDLVPDWNALSEAKAAYALHSDNPHKMAEEWSRRAAAFYNWFDLIAPQRVRELASVNPEHVLIDAFVVSWENQVPVLYWELVYLDETVSPSVRTLELPQPYQEMPYTTNATTRDLFEGDSQRTKDAAAQWKKMSLNIPAAELDWRWVEFIIKSTSSYDGSVGPDVNVIQIPVGGKAEWLQNLTCKDELNTQVQRDELWNKGK